MPGGGAAGPPGWPQAWPFSPGVLLLALGAAVLGAAAAAGALLWLVVRPALRAFERACAEVEKASKAAEVAAAEVERASLVLQEDVPRAADATEAAGRGVEQLSEELSGSGAWLQSTATDLPEAVQGAVQERIGAAQREVVGFAGPWQGSVQEIATGVVAEVEKWQQGLAAAVATFERVQRVEWERAAALREAGQMSLEGKGSLERTRMSLAEEAVEEALAKAQVAADAAEVASEDLVKAVTDFEELQEKGAQVFKTVERKNEWARPPPALPTGTGSEGSSTTG